MSYLFHLTALLPTSSNTLGEVNIFSAIRDLVVNSTGEGGWISWAQVFSAIFLALLLDFVQRRIVARLKKRLERTDTPWDEAVLDAVTAPVSMLIWVCGIAQAATFVRVETRFMDDIVVLTLIAAVTWFITRLIRNAQANIIAIADRKADQEDRLDPGTVDAIGKLARTAVLITAVLIGLQQVGINISAILAFGGIGGIAVGFAAKDLLANFFGGLMIYLDRPFKTGDWIRSPDRNIEGTVEAIGWRLTRIRTFDKRPLFVPNSIFAGIAVENPQRMLNRRIYETIGIRYDDLPQMQAITTDVKKMLTEHPEIDATQTLMVNFNAFGPSSVDFFVYTFTRTTNWQYFHQVKHQILLQISEIITGHGAEIAFPTTTLHVASLPPRAGKPDRRSLERTTMPDFIYTMKDLRKVLPSGREILKDIWLSFFHGAKIGIVGLNGSGKSSLLRIMAGQDQEFMGEAFPMKGIKIGFLPQEPVLDESKTVLGNVEEGVAETKALVDEFNTISERFAEPLDGDEMEKLLEKQAKLQDKIDAADAWDLDRRLEIAMDALRCPPGDSPVTHLSGGERRRVALCRLLLQQPELLLLDEPTNHLDVESVAWLERHLQEYPGTVVAVTHDRYFLDNVAGWILELDRGQGIPWEGNYSSWLDQKRQRLEKEEKASDARKRSLDRELEWVRMAPRARHAKSKARLKAYDELLRDGGPEERGETQQIYIPPGQRLGDKVIEAEGLSKAFDDKLLFEDLSFRLPPAGIVGVVGANGAGKTTLFRMLVDEVKPDAGTLSLGDTVKTAYVDQSRDDLDGSKQVWEAISGGLDEVQLGKRLVKSRAYASWFNFKGSDQQKLVKDLSGGERNRVHLGRLLRSGANLLLLDEPTNDLDVDTLRALEDAILNFAGCVVVISHDRWFLDRIATHILAFEGDSQVVWFEGNCHEYEADRKRRLGVEADQPHRIKYRRLTHD